MQSAPQNSKQNQNWTQNWTGAPEELRQSRRVPKIANAQGQVVSDDLEASAWGEEVLRRGGNAVDAAVAAAFMLAVTRPHFGSLGGGGFFLYCPNRKSAAQCTAMDYREKAPAAIRRSIYFKNGKADSSLAQTGGLASGVPGVVAGLIDALSHHGKWGVRKLPELLSRPIERAERGIEMTPYMEAVSYQKAKDFNDEAKKILGCQKKGENFKPCAVHARVIQKDLARVLRTISKKGRDGFYDGWVAQKIVDGLRSVDGVMSRQDLKNYKPRFFKPIVFEAFGSEVVSMPPPSGGGILLKQLFQSAEAEAAKERFSHLSFGAVNYTSAMIREMNRSYEFRAKFLGDPEFTKIPDHTTHFSVVDREGNAVALTTTVNDNFGSGFVPPGTGIFMNNEMDDFSLAPGVANQFGLVGSEANAVEPGKRPLSSMTPTIVRELESHENRIVIGAAGGPKITTAVFQVLMNRIYFGMSLPDAVSAPRIHAQWKPETVKLETFGFSDEVKQGLQSQGYELKEEASLARVHALERFPKTKRVWSGEDLRGEGR